MLQADIQPALIQRRTSKLAAPHRLQIRRTLQVRAILPGAGSE